MSSSRGKSARFRNFPFRMTGRARNISVHIRNEFGLETRVHRHFLDFHITIPSIPNLNSNIFGENVSIWAYELRIFKNVWHSSDSLSLWKSVWFFLNVILIRKVKIEKMLTGCTVSWNPNGLNETINELVQKTRANWLKLF